MTLESGADKAVRMPGAEWTVPDAEAIDRSITVRAALDPAVETIILLERSFARAEDIPPSIGEAYRKISASYGIPMEMLDEMASPLLPLEEELRNVIIPRKDLWESMFYPTSHQENLIAWAFYFLEREGVPEELDLPRLRRLIALMLSREVAELEAVDGLPALMRFLDEFPCSGQTKWICVQVWQRPDMYYRQYRELVALAEPVIRRHEDALRAAAERAVADAAGLLERSPGEFWETMGIPEPHPGPLVVAPMAMNFNGLGVTWDHTSPRTAAYVFVGIFRKRIRELRSRYCDNSEYIATAMKSLAEQRRVDILKALREGPLYGHELARRLGLTPATISHHMSSLVASGFVSVEHRGTRTVYSLHRQNMEGFLQNLRRTLL